MSQQQQLIVIHRHRSYLQYNNDKEIRGKCYIHNNHGGIMSFQHPLQHTLMMAPILVMSRIQYVTIHNHPPPPPPP